MVSNTTQHPLPGSSRTQSVQCTVRWEGGEVNHREGSRGNSSQSWVENTIMTDCISNLWTLLNTSKDDIFSFGVFVVN